MMILMPSDSSSKTSILGNLTYAEEAKMRQRRSNFQVSGLEGLIRRILICRDGGYFFF